MSRALALCLLLAASLVPVSQARIDGLVGAFRAQEDVLYLWNGEQVRRMLPGFESLAADIYWLRTVQYYGGRRRFADDKRFELLRPLIEITTTLDPRLEIAYRYGAVFESEPPPIGAGRPLEGIGVLEKGVKAMPQSWRLRQDLGFFHFLYLKDAAGAAAVLQDAAEIPGAPFWLRTLAADLLARGGDRAASRRMWTQMFEQGEEGVIRENARAQLQVLHSLDLADAAGQAVAAFAERRGRRPRSLDELLAERLSQGPFVDAAGVPLGYNPQTGRVFVRKDSPMWRPDPSAEQENE
jgi:hypothetical protein